MIINDVYLYSTKLYANPLKLSLKNFAKPYLSEMSIDSYPPNERIETIIIRDLKMAYGL